LWVSDILAKSFNFTTPQKTVLPNFIPLLREAKQLTKITGQKFRTSPKFYLTPV